MKLDLRLDRIKTWWCHKNDKTSEELFYPDIYDLQQHSFEILHNKSNKPSSQEYSMPFENPLDSYMEKLRRILRQEDSDEFLNLFEESYERVLKGQNPIKDSHAKEIEMGFAFNWRSWGEALVARNVKDIDNKELFKNAIQNGFYVDEEWGYISLRKRGIGDYFTRKQLNDFYKEKKFLLPRG